LQITIANYNCYQEESKKVVALYHQRCGKFYSSVPLNAEKEEEE
jgi:hypothetical protein